MASVLEKRDALYKLRRELRLVHYPEEANYEKLCEGDAEEFVRIYRWLFTDYSLTLAAAVASSGHAHLRVLSDAQLIDAIFIVLRDVLSYRSALTKEQFRTRGPNAFVAHKARICAEVCALARTRFPPASASRTFSTITLSDPNRVMTSLMTQSKSLVE
jgi:hypothetical protein